MWIANFATIIIALRCILICFNDHLMKFTIDLYKQEFSLLHTVLYCVTTESDY